MTLQHARGETVRNPASHAESETLREDARVVMTRPQKAVAAGLAGAAGIWLLLMPAHMLSTTLLAIMVLYLVSSLARLWIMLHGLRAPLAFAHRDTDLDDTELPTYTVLVPAYREAALIPDIVRAVSALDYPSDKLEILILLEEDDVGTRAALDAIPLPSFIRPVTFPDIGPRGKPRACNVGLAHACGELLVIYDVEDVPETDQLRKAVDAFRRGGPRLACVQARLDFYNAGENLLTRWFAAEYATWFGLYLPGLQRARLPIPLGGTSNHLRVSMLRALGGWDSWNVTEDADLGMRIARAGYDTVSSIPSPGRRPTRRSATGSASGHAGSRATPSPGWCTCGTPVGSCGRSGCAACWASS